MPRALLFLSDLHLAPERPAELAAFLAVLAGPARNAAAIYLLGDLFEAWIGDDDPAPLVAESRDALRAVMAAGVPVYFQAGNRDFLLGEGFLTASGMRLLPDFHLLHWGGERLLLTHGDLLCTEDRAYQRLRACLRRPALQRGYLALPLAGRRWIAARLRRLSQRATAGKARRLVDVDPAAVLRVMTAHNAQTLIHGHTHRAGVHEMDDAGVVRRRIVLPDWYGAGGALWWTEGGDFRLVDRETLLADRDPPLAPPVDHPG
jgi:UDP-2,3-diacylglucosamine hydrolase